MDLTTILHQAVEHHSDDLALVEGARQWTYSSWYARVKRFAHALSELGVRPGDRVAIYLPPGESYLTTTFATQILGAVSVPVHNSGGTDELALVLRDSSARILVYDGNVAEMACDLQSRVRSTHDFVACGADLPIIPDGHLGFEKLAEAHFDGYHNFPHPKGDDLTSIVYSPGQNGQPVGVMRSHDNDVAIAMSCVMGYGLMPADITLHLAPFHLTGGMQAFFVPHLMVGATHQLIGNYDTEQALQTIQDACVTTLFATPTQLRDMILHPAFREYDVSTLRMVTVGGSVVTAATVELTAKELCSRVYAGYGVAEAEYALALKSDDIVANPGTCGRRTLISGCRVAHHDPESQTPNNENLSDGDIGELLVRGPQVTAGYWNNPHETSNRLKAGWFHTRELFERDENGYFFYHGSIGAALEVDGETVYPRDVEAALYGCEGVQEAAVFGLTDRERGIMLTAFIQRSDPPVDMELIEEFCDQCPALDGAKRPKRLVFVDDLTFAPNGKVLKDELLKRYGYGGEQTK